jgi:stage II sporulation protein D
LRAFLVFASLLFSTSAAWAGDAVVRVHVADAAAVRLSGDLAYEGKRIRGDGRDLRVTAAGDNLVVAGDRDPGTVAVDGGGLVAVDGKKYRGALRLFARKGRVQVVNDVPIEQYLASVLGGEMGAAWPEEALKAQAVVARSYALAKAAASKTRPFDVDATVLSQVYKGVAGEAPSTRAAVDDTEGKVLTYGGKIVEAYFHSCCGGRTEDGRALWGGNLAYLSSVKDKYCDFAPDYFWVYRIAPGELGKRVGLGSITAVKVLERAPGGRALRVQFEAGRADKVLDGDAVRRAVGYAKLKSTLFRIAAEGGQYVFKGSGSGHGVGMCQWGARAQAEQGRNYREILKFYFPEADLDRL